MTILLLAGAAWGALAGDDGLLERRRNEWNAAVDYYREGNVSNALHVLRALTDGLRQDLSPQRGQALGWSDRRVLRERYVSASELLAKLCHEEAHGEGAENPAKSLEEAARAAQVALLERPDDPRANRNFTRSTEGLREAQEVAHVNRVLQANRGKDPSALLQQATEGVRAVMTEAATSLDQPAEAAVSAADRLSKRADELADVWISVRDLVCQSVTNEEQAATIVDQTDRARAATRKAAVQLADMQADAYTTLADVEQDYTRFLKQVIMPPAAIRADYVAQSNAWQDVEMFNGRPWQPDALDYTRAFNARFQDWARAYEQQAQADTNKPPFAAEEQAKVVQLAGELEKIQQDCCQAPDPSQQERALEIIREIIELLPDEGGGGQSQDDRQQNQGQQDKDGSGNDNRQPEGRPPQDDRQDDGGQDQRQEQNQEQNDRQDDRPQAGEDDAETEEIEANLKKAQERSDEHEADKKARMRKLRLPPNERDW